MGGSTRDIGMKISSHCVVLWRPIDSQVDLSMAFLKLLIIFFYINNVNIYKFKVSFKKFKYITNDSTKSMKIIIQTYKLHNLKIYNK